jgi:putative ABC transport system ATP-binding protein
MIRLLDAVAIWKRFGALDVLKGVDVSVTPGECLVLLGPSGSGKSTLLRCLNLLEPIASGSIMFEGQEIANTPRKQAALLRRRMGMVFQNFELFQHLSAEDNIIFGPIRVRHMPVKQARELARHLLRKVHLPDKAAAFPDELSGGQQQRVAIARALIGGRSLLLADEPTGSLDSLSGEAVMRLLRGQCDGGSAVVLVTHDSRHAAWADRVVYLRDGRLVDELGPPAGPESVLRRERV